MKPDNRLNVALILWLLVDATAALFILAFVNIPDKNQSLFNSLVTLLIIGVIVSYSQFQWGSSKGSSQKDDTIQSLTDKVKQ